MKKILQILIFVAAISFFACDQDLTGYEIPNQSDNKSQELSYVEGVSSSRLVFATNFTNMQIANAMLAGSSV